MLRSTEPDTKPGAYYVTVMRGDGDYRLLLGPFWNDHGAALAMVDAVRGKAEEIDPRAAWYSFGTSRVELSAAGVGRPGSLNEHFKAAMAEAVAV